MLTSDISSLLPPPQTPISLLSPSQAAALVLHRRKVRTSLLDWSIEALKPAGYSPASHHRLLIRELEAVTRGETRKLMVLMPPGSAKTTYGSYLYPTHLMALGNKQVLAASHTIERAAYVSKQCQRYISENSGVLGYALASENVEQWRTTNNCEYLAAGVGKGIAGFRADLGLIDDPVKTKEAADSSNSQDKIWDWYWSDFFTRLRPGASQILIMTRWSEGDLGGRLEEAEGDTWRVIRLPAIAETGDALGRAAGEYLWSDDGYGFGAKLKDDFVSLNRAGMAREWSAMYQQRPAPDTGAYFDRSWLRPVASMPPLDSLRVYGGSDYAVTADGGDYTVHVVVGIDSDGRLWLLDLWRGQTASDVWVRAFCDLVKRWKPMAWGEETGQINAGVGPYLLRTMREQRAYVARYQIPSRHDKAVRAQAIRGRMAVDGLCIPEAAPWRTDFENELMSFPVGKHDDQVDALSLVGQLLDKMITPTPEPKAEPLRGTLDMTMAEAWKHADPRARSGNRVRF